MSMSMPSGADAAAAEEEDPDEPTVACSAGDGDGACGEGKTCLLPAGRCDDLSGAAAVVGTCVVAPEACPALYDPVCGCGGRTRSSACHALMAREAVAHEGECEGTGVADLVRDTAEAEEDARPDQEATEQRFSNDLGLLILP